MQGWIPSPLSLSPPQTAQILGLKVKFTCSWTLPGLLGGISFPFMPKVLQPSKASSNTSSSKQPSQTTSQRTAQAPRPPSAADLTLIALDSVHLVDSL